MCKQRTKKSVKLIIFLCIFIFFMIGITNKRENIVITNKTYYKSNVDTNNMIYLSDIDYVDKIEGKTTDEYRTYVEPGYYYRKDKNASSGMISVKVNDKRKYFTKGISAWATSNVIFDLSKLDTTYDKFQAYLGVDASEPKNNWAGAKIIVYVMKKGESEWKEVKRTDKLTSLSNAVYADIDLKDVKYLRLYADEMGNDWYTMWADNIVYADAKLIKEGYTPKEKTFDIIKKVSDYDKELKEKDINNIESYEKTLLQREFVNNIGYNILQELMNTDTDYYDVVKWLIDDTETLRLFLLGGTPDGSYASALKILNDLRIKYAYDLENTGKTKENTVYKDLYRKMMVTISLTHSQSVGSWITGAPEDINAPNGSNPLRRYEIFQKLHLNQNSTYSQQTVPIFQNKMFENLSVEEMRFVMNNIISDDEILWLNNYSTNNLGNKKDPMEPYNYIQYDSVYNYNDEKYYKEERKNEWENKYYLNQFSYQVKYGVPRLWMVFEEGAVCGGISKTGSNLWGVHGVPSSVISQPAHAAYMYLKYDSKGRKIWELGNNIDGWPMSGKTEKLTTRMPLGWGSGDYVGEYPASYVLLAQAALDDKTPGEKRENKNLTNYEATEELLYLAKVYDNDKEKQEEIYRKAIEKQSINFDAWLGLVNLYKNDETKTQDEYVELIKEITTKLNYYPLPMHDLIRILENKLDDTHHIAYQVLLNDALEKASNATEDEVLQSGACNSVAKFLLGRIDTTVATFSFDKEDANTIKLAEKYSIGQVVWQYTLEDPAKGNWSENIYENSHKLTDEEISKISAEHGISIRIVGAMDTIYNIKIEQGEIPKDLEINDLENRFIGITPNIEWSYSEDEEWSNFQDKEPNLKGNKIIYIRQVATGNKLQSSIKKFTFTNDGEKLDHFYIPLSRLSIADFSSEEAGKNNKAENLLDGRTSTIWHTKWDNSDKKLYIIFKLERPSYIDAIEYVPRQDSSFGNGTITSARISVSSDEELNDDTSWDVIKEETSWVSNNKPKRESLKVDKPVTYVKIEALKSAGDFASAAMFNFFEDNTKYDLPAVNIEYDKSVNTNEKVTANLILDPANIGDNSKGIITEDTKISDVLVLTDKTGQKLENQDFKHTFTTSGEHHFYYASKADYEQYEDGKIDLDKVKKGRITAKVDWLQTGNPPVDIKYFTSSENEEYEHNISKKTNKDIKVKILSKDKNRKLTITNNEGEDTYIFNDNGEFTFEYIDNYGNSGSKTIEVNSIDRTPPIGHITYNTTSSSVKAKLNIDDQDVIIKNNNGKDTYTFNDNGSFEFNYVDEAGNENTTVATVDWLTTKENYQQPSKTKIIENKEENIETANETYDNEEVKVKKDKDKQKENNIIKKKYKKDNQKKNNKITKKEEKNKNKKFIIPGIISLIVVIFSTTFIIFIHKIKKKK